MEKFNYQVIFKLNDDNRIIFTGSTTDYVGDVLKYCCDILEAASIKAGCESVLFQPVKVIENESKA